MGRSVELVLVDGERRTTVVAGETGSIGTALDRLGDWIETDDGGWVHKRYVVEARPLAVRPRSEAEAVAAPDDDTEPAQGSPATA